MGSSTLGHMQPQGSAPEGACPPETSDAESTDRPGRCAHKSAHPTEWPWLPTEHHGHLEKHAWCSKCGAIAASGKDRALNYGGLVNQLGHIERSLNRGGRRLTSVQKRLILARLRELDIDDTYALTRQAQTRVFYDALERHTGLSPSVIETYLHAC